MKKIKTIVIAGLFSISSILGANFANAQECMSYQTHDIKLSWTAYKYTEKAPVGGVFINLDQDNSLRRGTLNDLLKEVILNIDLLSSATGSKKRDENLLTGFFKVIQGPTASVKVKEVVEETSNQGKLTALLQMNGVERSIAMEYFINNNVFRAEGSLDMLDFVLGKALESLDSICHDLHTGTDGVSKVWSSVDVVLEVPVSQCIQ